MLVALGNTERQNEVEKNTVSGDSEKSKEHSHVRAEQDRMTKKNVLKCWKFENQGKGYMEILCIILKIFS